MLVAVAVLFGGLAFAPASQVAAQQSDRISVEELKTLLADKKPVVVLDVRDGDVESKIKGAAHIPLDQVEARAGELPRTSEIITYCA